MIFSNKETEEYLDITKKWCAKNLDLNDLANCFRNDSVMPAIDITDYSVLKSAKNAEIIKLNHIKKSQLDLDKIEGELQGSVLLYYPQRSLGDALVASESSDFFSDDDAPPYGTWFHFERNEKDDEDVLYCWIPDEIYGYIDKSLEVDFYDCLLWL